VLEGAREQIAVALGVGPGELVLTGGGTESCNLGVFGPPAPSVICCSTVEHAAVRTAAKVAAAELGVEMVELPVDAQGVLDLDQALGLIPEGALVSVMAANNETGAIQPVAELRAALAREGREVILHCDAIAASPTMALDEIVGAADLISLAGHKLGGPASSGILVVKRGIQFRPRSFGGGQELERRAGTQDVAGALGMAVAIDEARREIASGSVEVLRSRRDRLQLRLTSEYPDLVIHASSAPRLAGHLHLSVPGCLSEELLVLLDRRGICASAGAACSSGAPQASHVLMAMGVSERVARGSLRLTLSVATSDEEVDRAAQLVSESIAALRPR
jgi:cysteine desulfurase